jgi:hypothetical protein
VNRFGLLGVILALASAPAAADEPPDIDHQPSPCTVPNEPVSVCASIFDDQAVSKVRVYFRPQGERYFSYADMTFSGLEYCATLPAPRDDKLKTLEYYLQAADDAFQTRRSSTWQMAVQEPEACPFPPVEKDAARAASITVYATHKKQGDKLDDKFVREGVNFVAKGR